MLVGEWAGFCPPTRPPTPLIQTPHTPGGYQPHAKEFFLFGFIHEGRSFDLFQCAFGGFFQYAFGGVGGLLGGVGEPLSFPTCFGKDMSIRRALGYMNGPNAVREATQARVML